MWSTKMILSNIAMLFGLLMSIQGMSVSAEDCEGTRIVVLAGPRRAATTSVAEFFYTWARGPQPNRAHGNKFHPLAKFRWPLVYGPESNQTETERPYKRYNYLVTDPTNQPLRDEIINAIKRDYDQVGIDAVIFGGEEFDQVGDAAIAGDNAIQAVRDVQEALGAPSECVEIVLNYRVPRFAHWISLYSSLSLLETDDPDDNMFNEFLPYEEHMCEDENSEWRMAELGTSMNPMYLAETYLQADPSWRVKMIDMGGVVDYETDISHVIGCEILGGRCNQEKRWVKGHIEETINNKALQNDFNSLPKEEIADSEMIFRYRDCAYQQDFMSYEDRFQIVHHKGIWGDCNHEDDTMEAIYQSLRSPQEGNRLVFEALLSQVDCEEYGISSHPEVPHSIQEILSGVHLDDQSMNQYGLETLKESFDLRVIIGILLFIGIGGLIFVVKKRQGGSVSLHQNPRIELNRLGKSNRNMKGSRKPTSYRDTILNQVNRDTHDDASASSEDVDSSDDEDNFEDEGRQGDFI